MGLCCPLQRGLYLELESLHCIALYISPSQGEGDGDWSGQEASSWHQAGLGVQEEDNLPNEEQEQQVQQSACQPRWNSGQQRWMLNIVAASKLFIQ